MTRPDVTAPTELVYARLPELYRVADEAQADGPSGYPLLRYLSLVLDQLAPLVELVARFAYLPLDDPDDQPTDNPFGIAGPWRRYGTGLFGENTYGGHTTPRGHTSDLVDPAGADAGWLPWLAQLLGVNPTGLDATALRARLSDPSGEWAHGTPAALIREARRGLTPTSQVTVTPHYQGDPFAIAVTIDADDVTPTTTFADLEAASGGTWAGLEALGPMDTAGIGTIRALLEHERPAGYTITVLTT